MLAPPETLEDFRSEKAQRRFSQVDDLNAPTSPWPTHPSHAGSWPTFPPSAGFGPAYPPAGFWSSYLAPVFLPQPPPVEVKQQFDLASPGTPLAAPPLTSVFSDLHPEDLISVISHTLRSEDLYKLDTLKLHKHKDEYRVGSGGEVEVHPVTGCAEDYPHPYSILIPLTRYFKILEFHSASLGRPGWIGYYFQCYLEQLTKDMFTYEWHAVRLYHLRFFNARLEDMKRGHYNGWQDRDIPLAEQYLYKHVRKSSEGKRSRTL